MPRRNAKRGPRKITTLTAYILDLPLSEALDTARAWWPDHHLLDDLDTPQVERDLDDLLTASHDLDIRTIGEALPRAADLITRVADVKSITSFLKDPDSHRVYRLRNHLAAALSACVQAHEQDPTLVIKDLPLPQPRAGGIDRRLLDDEVLLMRLRAVHCIHKGGRHRRSGVQYALIEAGALPVESTTVFLKDFDNPRRPMRVRLPGARYHASRTIALPRWTQPLLAEAFDALLATSVEATTTARVAYGGDAVNSKNPSAAASIMLRRTMISAGLTEDCVKPIGVLKWRAKQAMKDGFQAVQDLLGKDTAIQVHNFIGPEPTDLRPERLECDIDFFDVDLPLPPDEEEGADPNDEAA